MPPMREPEPENANPRDYRESIGRGQRSIGRRQERADQRDCPLCEEVISSHERILALERWQTAQNGSLRRIEEKQDRFLYWIMGSLFTTALALVGIVITLLRTAKS